jgi:prepilin-type N-terminal cleavage/methylation domain-containing protein
MKTRGFTLVETIVVVSIIAILSSVGMFSYNQAAKQSRDSNRQADLKQLQVAIELYKQKNGSYPAGCNGPGAWSGQVGTSYACSGGSGQYIAGLAPQFIRFLPQDKRLNGVNSGYAYFVNAAATSYKIIAYRTVESETVDYSSKLKGCESTNSDTGACDATSPQGPWGGSAPPKCDVSDTSFQVTYALWGGFPFEPFALTTPARSEEEREKVVCQLP